MLKKRNILNQIKSRQKNKYDQETQITNDICFLFDVYNKDVKLVTTSGKSFSPVRTKHWEKSTFSLDFGDFSCTVARHDYWFRSPTNQKYVHERRHHVEWNYRGDKHSIASYDMGPLLATLGDKRPNRAGIIFGQVLRRYKQSHR